MIAAAQILLVAWLAQSAPAAPGAPAAAPAPPGSTAPPPSGGTAPGAPPPPRQPGGAPGDGSGNQRQPESRGAGPPRPARPVPPAKPGAPTGPPPSPPPLVPPGANTSDTEPSSADVPPSPLPLRAAARRTAPPEPPLPPPPRRRFARSATPSAGTFELALALGYSSSRFLGGGAFGSYVLDGLAPGMRARCRRAAIQTFTVGLVLASMRWVPIRAGGQHWCAAGRAGRVLLSRDHQDGWGGGEGRG